MNAKAGNMSRVWRTLVFVLILVGFMMLCLVGVLQHGEAKMRRTTFDLQTAAGSLKHMEMRGRVEGDNILHPKFDLYFMSKRRVPNGPDPIHNRRAGNSHQPPGKA